MSPPPDPVRYDRVLVAFSGGKGSLAALLHVLALGVPRDRIELHHHEVDGRGPSLMDWPCTAGYVRAVADHFGLRLYLSWREGGFAREMDRGKAATAPIWFEHPEGLSRTGGHGPVGTRGRFPQLSPDLRVRWCSSSLKIDVFAAVIRNQPRFQDGGTLVVTGERAEESAQRARYASFERHRTSSGRRRVDHWRPVLHWREAEVWDAIASERLRPHPAYVLGWGRLSCRTCIFGSARQWATLRLHFPGAFDQIRRREAASGCTIHRSLTIDARADRGEPYAAAAAFPDERSQADDPVWRLPILLDPWMLPAGAFGDHAGPP